MRGSRLKVLLRIKMYCALPHMFAGFKVPADAPVGAAAQNGTLKYQACNDRMCFAPKTVPISLSLNIE